ncbi:MAG: DUF4091 domain-containing protein [Candidatus Omnitrophica bacterium]|nr:DUF4091 domain-containing protein [Candidatus Omnitrophota bacterium]
MESIRKGTLFLILLFITSWIVESSTIVTGERKETILTIKNEFVKVVVQPDPFAGFIKELHYLPTGRQITASEHFLARGGEGAATQRTNLGYLYKQAKDIKWQVIKDTPEEQEISVSYWWEGKQAGRDYKLRLEQLYSLKAGESRIKVVWRIENHAKETCSIGPWVKNTMLYSGNYFTMLEKGPGAAPRDRFFPSFTNWLARTGKSSSNEKDETFFVVGEHRFFKDFYVWTGENAYTLEIICNPIDIPPGQSWSITYFLCLAPNLPSVAWAAPEGVVSINPLMVKQPEPIQLRLQFAPVMNLGKVRIEGVMTFQGKEFMALAPNIVDWTTGKLSEVTYSFIPEQPGVYFLRLNVYQNEKQYPLGKEVDAFQKFIEIPIMVGEIPAGEIVSLPWPREEVKYAEIDGSFLEIPIVGETGEFKVGLAHPTQRVFREDRLSKTSPIEKRINRYAARGEWESIQLVVFPEGKSLTGVRINVSPFRNRKVNAEFSVTRIYRVGHIVTKEPSNFLPYPVGYYPDPLLPMTEPVEVKDGLNVSFWINIQVPMDVPAGNYEGIITIASDRSQVSVPVNLKVWNFELPTPPALKTWAGAVGFNIKKQMEYQGVNNYDTKKIVENFIKLCLDYGFVPGFGIPGWNITPEELNKWNKYNRGLSVLPSTGYGKVANWATQENAQHYNWKGKLYHYAPFDEHGDTVVPQVAEWCRNFKKEHPHIKIVDVYYGANTEPLHGLVDVWCRGLRRDEWTKQRMEAGDEFWRVNAHLLWEIEQPDVFRGRSEYWQMWAYGYTGQLMWSVANWSSPPPDFRGLGTNAMALMLYPIPGGIAPTLRWENMRDGLEDYDYLYLLREYTLQLERKGEKHPLLTRAKEIWSDPDIHLKVSGWKELESLRQEIGNLIEKLKSYR